MGRRSAGEGTVYQSKNGRWIAMLELPRHPDGKRNRKMRRARTQTEAKRQLAEIRREHEDHGSVSSKSRMMVDTIADHLDNRRAGKSGKAGPKTIERDELFARRMSSFLSHRKTSDLTVTDCDRLLDAFATGKLTATGKPPSKNYITRARAFLKNALTNDMRLGYINRNAAELAVVPETNVESKERRSLTIEEWNQLYAGSSGTTKLIVDLGGRHALRPQEIRSISWPDISFDNQTLSVFTQQSSDDEQVDPKTNNSFRTIMLHPDTIALLADWRTKQHKLKIKAGPTWFDGDYIITTKRGTVIQRHNQRRSIHGLCDKLDLKRITPYELRHTAISHQIEAGTNLTQVAEWAGTSIKMIQDHYRHKLQQISMVPPLQM